MEIIAVLCLTAFPIYGIVTGMNITYKFRLGGSFPHGSRYRMFVVKASNEQEARDLACQVRDAALGPTFKHVRPELVSIKVK